MHIIGIHTFWYFTTVAVAFTDVFPSELNLKSTLRYLICLSNIPSSSDYSADTACLYQSAEFEPCFPVFRLNVDI